MQNSPETLSLPTELKSTLAQLMKEATFSEECLFEDALPVVVMQHQHTIVAFAIGEQDDYRPLYEAFKKLYLKNSSLWSIKDVAFVYCLPVDIAADPEFCSRVEVDVYFCRKYVVHLGMDIAESLARLPFLPLSPITPGVQTRPPSAQKLLRQHNIKTDLAKALVVPMTSSPPKILAGCLAGNYGPPESLQPTTGLHAIAEVKGERSQSTLKSIAIENFRAYRKKKVFEFGSAVTILYGPNGFGKTSFFDAIDFVVTGGVGRLTRTPNDLARMAKHLDSNVETTEVTLTIERDGDIHEITRNLADPNNAIVNKQPSSRKEVLSLLTGGTTPGADRVDSLVDLFRATHLFSQENQELTQDVASNCELSAELVSRMLAFEDYASGLKKVEEVLKLAVQEHNKATSDITKAKQALADQQQELARLEGLAAKNTTVEALDDLFTNLEASITSAGFSITGIELRDTRSLRAMLDAAAAEATARRKTLSRAIENIGRRDFLRLQLDSIDIQRSERLLQLSHAEEVEKGVADKASNLSSLLAQLKTQRQNIQLRRDWLDWSVLALPEYAQLTGQTQDIASELANLSALTQQEQLNVSSAQATQYEASASLKKSEFDFKLITERLSKLHKVNDATIAWKKVVPTLFELIDAEIKLNASLQEERRKLENAKKALNSQDLILSQTNQMLAEARHNDSRLKHLVFELRNHVDSPNCQLCGHDHGSVENLLTAIESRLQLDGHTAKLSEVASAQKLQLQALMVQHQAQAEAIQQEELNLAYIVKQRTALENQRYNYVELLSSVDLSLTEETPAQINVLEAQTQEEKRQTAEALSLAKQRLVSADTALTSAKARLQTLEKQRHEVESRLSYVRSRLAELQKDANRSSINLAGTLEETISARKSIDAEINSIESAIHLAEEQKNQNKTAHAAAKAAVNSAQVSYQQANQAWTEHQAELQSVFSELKAKNFDTTVSTQDLTKQVEAASARYATALALRDHVAELEIAVDTAATSAAFQSIRQNILTHHTLIQESTEYITKLKPWVDYFSEVKKLLSTQQSLATNHFITEYGPRTAIIQQRLRPVYGFGEIEVSSKDSKIGIRVRRKDETLRPTDFFSQSQVQTLVLGLFLTACSSQTWSGFSSIMMDDPVTHFDDLNTYALLDLILGLQSSQEGERQFVISTCDEKLLQLARHKFRHLGSAAKFYRFQAIGTEGPMVAEITP